MNYLDVQRELRMHSNPARAKSSAWFFKTGRGEYGEGDKFLGLVVAEQRKIAYKFIELPLAEITKLIKSHYHEDRFTALEILVAQYERGDSIIRKKITNLYITQTKLINNWDLVDTSAPYILGHYTYEYSKKWSILFRLAKSKNLWERRIAIISTQYFISQGRFDKTLAIAELLLNDTHDLIHKAVGWMLREVGKRDLKTLQIFLQKHAKRMPRTMLRYSIEKFPEMKRKKYLSGTM